MDSTPVAGKFNESEVELNKSFHKSDHVYVVNTLNRSVAANGAACLVPITPDSNKENADLPFNCISPISVVMRPLNVTSLGSNKVESNGDSHTANSPQTPKDCVFDPFAAGPDDKAWAPMCKKYVEEMRTHVNRCLNFGSSAKPLKYDSDDVGVDNYTEEEMIEFVYKNLLEAIVIKQAEIFLAEFSNDSYDSNAFQTPPSAPRTNGTAETCPGAPIRSSERPRKIDMVGLCKKLEF